MASAIGDGGTLLTVGKGDDEGIYGAVNKDD